MYLQTLENLKEISWCDRLNAGRMSGVRLCRAGTPDIWFRRVDGQIIWIEAKSPKGKLRESQEQFKRKMTRYGDLYWVIRDCRELMEKMAELDETGILGC